MKSTGTSNNPARAGQTTSAVIESPAAEVQSFSLPMKRWFTLKEACAAKGLSYKTSCNRTILQPARGVAEGRIGGRKCWRYETILEWHEQADADIAGGAR